MSYSRFDPKRLIFLPLKLRKNKMTVDDVLPLNYGQIPKCPDMANLARKVMEARRRGKEVIWLMGAHALRRGNSRYIIDLIKKGIISHLASNAAAAIHDFELSFMGATTEDVEFYIRDGYFGNWEETGRYMNEAIVRGYSDGIGMGEAIGRMIENEECGKMAHAHLSVFAAAYRYGIPVTIHKGIGQDIIDQHPGADFSAIGKTSGDDFMIFADSISRLEGGVFLNIGSQVMGPEVYLKALSMSRNVARQKGEAINNFTTAVFDLVPLGNWKSEGDVVNYKKPGVLDDPRYYFRPLKSILVRTVKDGGESFYFKGDLGKTIPQLYQSIIGIED